MSEFSQLKKDLSKVLGHKPKKRRLDNIHSSPESTDGVGTTESQAEETIDAIDSTPPYTTADDAGTARNPTEPPSSSVKPAPTYVLIPSAVVLSTEVDTPLSEHGDSHDQYPGMNTPEDHDSSYPLYPDIYRPPTNLEEDDVSPLASRSSRSYHHPSSALADDYKMLSLPHGSSNGPSKQPRYRNHADDENNSPQNWDGKAIEMESDDENMSIVVSLKLASELSLLKSVLDLYRNFNINLGDIVSGARHKGFLKIINSSVRNLARQTARLRISRKEQQRGSPEPGRMELVANKIIRRCKADMRSVWNLIGEKIDMTDKEAKAKWLNKRRRVLGGVMGGLSSYLDELEEGRSDWRQEEMREMSDMWVKRWKTYAKLPAEELKNIGWIEDVTKGKAA